MNRRDEWEDYGIAQLGCTNGCRTFTQVTHDTHIDAALQILRDGKLKPALTEDRGSWLSGERIFVCWLSPNEWGSHHGSCYGNIQFGFNWPWQELGDMNIYWVECAQEAIPATRILITKTNWDGKLRRYNPWTDNGPWRIDPKTETHYRNGSVKLQFLFEESIDVDADTRVRAILHAIGKCKLDPCPDRKLTEKNVRCHFLAGLVAGRVCGRPGWGWTTNESDKVAPTSILTDVACELISEIVRYYPSNPAGVVEESSGSASYLARAVLDAYRRREREATMHLCALYRDARALRSSIEKALSETFELEVAGHWSERQVAEQCAAEHDCGESC